jgi:hypothetical protein
MDAIKINTGFNNPNLLNYFMTFNDVFSWSVTSGTGLASHSTEQKATGERSLKITNSAYIEENVVINATGKNTGFTLTNTKQICLSFSAYNPTQSATEITQSLTVSLFKDASPFQTFDFTVDEFNKWVSYGQVLTLDAGVYSLTITQNRDLASLINSVFIYLDNFIFSDDKELLGLPTQYVEPLNTASLEKLGSYNYQSTLGSTAYTGTPVKLLNNGLGTLTNKTYGFTGIADVFNTTTNQFDFSSLSLGDIVNIRYDYTITTSAVNQESNLYLEIGVGGGSPTTRNQHDTFFKVAGSHPTTVLASFLMVSNLGILNFPTEIYFTSEANATVVLNDLLISVIKR